MNKTKGGIVSSLNEEENVQKVGDADSRERGCDLSLDFPLFGQSVRFGPRSKAVLRSEGYA